MPIRKLTYFCKNNFTQRNMNNTLKTVVDGFCLENDKDRQRLGTNLDKSLQFVALPSAPKEFEKVAKAILNGHFCVESSGKEINIYPVCVEIYYHEEQDGGVKDPIVYHRNRKKKSGDDNPPIFTTKGVLHNHVSGIDITFESEAKSKNKYVTGIVRASALIREFMVKDKDGNIIKAVKNGKEVDTDDRSTYLYQALFGQFSIFDGGFTVKWIDGKKKDFDEMKLKSRPRKNVMEYEYESDKSDYRKKGEQCKRAWRFAIADTNI